MPFNLLFLGFVILLALIGFAIYRARKTWRSAQEQALTIEEGMSAIKDRICARNVIQGLVAIGSVTCLSCGLALTAVYALRQPGFAMAIVFALETVCCIYLILLLYQKAADSGVIQILEDDAHSGNGGGTLHRLMRTYEYYRSGSEVPRPGLFDWLRRQLGLYVLGLDIQAHLPVSGARIARHSSVLMLCVLLVAAMLNYLDDSPNQFDFYHFAEGTTATEIDQDSDYRGAPDPGGTTQTPQYGADTPGEPESQFDRSETEQEYVEPDTQTMPPADPPQTEPPSDRTSPDPPDAGDEPSVLQKLVANLADLFGGAGQEEEPQISDTSDQPSPDGPMATAPSDDAVTRDKAEQTTAGEGTQQVQRASKPDSEQSSPEGDPTGTSENEDAPPSNEGAGGSLQARVSRGGGEGMIGNATDVPLETAANARNLELQVDQVDDDEPGKESEQPYRPQPFNAMVQIDPNDVSVTEADPVITQRIPRTYAETMRKLLSKQ